MNLDCSLGIVMLIVYITVLNNSGFFVGLERFIFVGMHDEVFFFECGCL